MIRRMGMESISILMGRSMKDIGKRISSTAMEGKYGLMVLNSRVTTSMARSKEKVHLPGQMVVPTRVISTKITFTGEEYIAGLTVVYTMGRGSVIKCMGTEYSRGLMEGSMKESMWMIRNKEGVCSSGPMEGGMLEAGLMASNMEKDSIYRLMEMKEKVNGISGKESDGLEIKQNRLMKIDIFVFNVYY